MYVYINFSYVDLSICVYVRLMCCLIAVFGWQPNGNGFDNHNNKKNTLAKTTIITSSC